MSEYEPLRELKGETWKSFAQDLVNFVRVFFSPI